MRKTILLFIFSTVFSVGFSQSVSFRRAFEIGVMGGGSYYIGDLNQTHFKYSKPAFGVIARYNLSTRHSLRFTATYGNVLGEDSKSNNTYLVNRNLVFHSSIIEVAMGFEIDLIKYRINDMKYPISPYFFYELAYFRMNPKAPNPNGGEDIALQEIGTEGQGTVLNTKKQYGLNQFSVPLGIGLKFNIKKRIAVSFEYGIRKTFTDYLDDVSGKYANPYALSDLKGPLAAQLADPSFNGQSYHTTGLDRGNANTKDWYVMYGAMLTIKPWNVTVCQQQGAGKGKKSMRRRRKSR